LLVLKTLVPNIDAQNPLSKPPRWQERYIVAKTSLEERQAKVDAVSRRAAMTRWGAMAQLAAAPPAPAGPSRREGNPIMRPHRTGVHMRARAPEAPNRQTEQPSSPSRARWWLICSQQRAPRGGVTPRPTSALWKQKKKRLTQTGV
jgi:hypothetical protein